jgi:hypothetical protein
MLLRVLPFSLALTALLGDLSGHHATARAVVLAAIPAAFAFALECYGDALQARCGGLRPLLAAAAVVLLMLSGALRSPAVVGGVPQLAVSSLVICLALYAGPAVAMLFTPPVRRRSRVRAARAAADVFADAA